MELQLVDGVSMTHVVLQAESSLISSAGTQSRGSQVWLRYLDALHADVVDDANDAPGAGHGQQRVAGVGVVGPRTRVEVLICLSTSGQVKHTEGTSGFELNTGRNSIQLQMEPLIIFSSYEPSRKLFM